MMREKTQERHPEDARETLLRYSSDVATFGLIKAIGPQTWINIDTRVAMDLESDTHSFIVKVWVEEPAVEAGEGLWRGHITHVSSGRRRYLKSLDEIGDFIAPYLEEMGIKLGVRWRMRSWLKRLTRRR
jgi:hypothetical protein